MKANTEEEALRLVALQDSVDNRQRWLEAIQAEMEQDKAPGGSKGHLVWVAQHIVCERCTPRVVVFRLEGHEVGARQWGPLVLGLLRRLTKEWGAPSLTLKDDGWREEYAASQKVVAQQSKSLPEPTPPPTPVSSEMAVEESEKPYQAPAEPEAQQEAHEAWDEALRVLVDKTPERIYRELVEPLRVFHSKEEVLWLMCEDREIALRTEGVCLQKIRRVIAAVTQFRDVRLCVPDHLNQDDG